MPVFLAFELVSMIVMALIAVALAVLALAVGLITHPLRTIAWLLNKIASVVGGLALILALLAWFGYDHTKSDFAPVFWGSVGTIVACVFLILLTQWFLDRPTRAERRAMEMRRLEQEREYEQRVRERLAWEREQRRQSEVGPYIDVQPAYIHDER